MIDIEFENNNKDNINSEKTDVDSNILFNFNKEASTIVFENIEKFDKSISEDKIIEFDIKDDEFIARIITAKKMLKLNFNQEKVWEITGINKATIDSYDLILSHQQTIDYSTKKEETSNNKSEEIEECTNENLKLEEESSLEMSPLDDILFIEKDNSSIIESNIEYDFDDEKQNLKPIIIEFKDDEEDKLENLIDNIIDTSDIINIDFEDEIIDNHIISDNSNIEETLIVKGNDEYIYSFLDIDNESNSEEVQNNLDIKNDIIEQDISNTSDILIEEDNSFILEEIIENNISEIKEENINLNNIGNTQYNDIEEDKSINSKDISENKISNNEKHLFIEWLNIVEKNYKKKDIEIKIEENIDNNNSIINNNSEINDTIIKDNFDAFLDNDSTSFLDKNNTDDSKIQNIDNEFDNNIESYILEQKNKKNKSHTFLLNKKFLDINELQIVSETLAKLYEEQGYFDKAIYIYEKLILKFPQKSVYFADKIKIIKENLK